MKKILTSALLIISMKLSAQEALRNKNGVVITPEKGEFSLGFDAAPFLKYAGNLLGSGNDSPGALFGANSPLTISCKYVKNDNTAYRMMVRLGMSVLKEDTLVPRLLSTNPNEKVANETKNVSSNIVIGGGLQKWRGKSRVRGFYGGELLLGITTDKTTYTYGNALSQENQTARIKQDKLGSGFSFHLRGFGGVEYFFAPKSSLSAEFGWGPRLVSTGRGERQTETWSGSGVETQTEETGKNSEFSFDNDNASGAINLTFYF